MSRVPCATPYGVARLYHLADGDIDGFLARRAEHGCFVVALCEPAGLIDGAAVPRRAWYSACHRVFLSRR